MKPNAGDTMLLETNNLVCALRPCGEYNQECLSGTIIFKTPRFSGEIDYLMKLDEYRRFVVYPLQTLADSFGKERREQIGNLDGNFFFDFRLRPNGKVVCRYELGTRHRLFPEESTIFRGTFFTDRLHIGQWLTQAPGDLREWKASLHLILNKDGMY